MLECARCRKVDKVRTVCARFTCSRWYEKLNIEMFVRDLVAVGAMKGCIDGVISLKSVLLVSTLSAACRSVCAHPPFARGLYGFLPVCTVILCLFVCFVAKKKT